MALKPDFHETLLSFVYSNLPILMNPFNAHNVVVTNTIIPTIPTAPTTPISPTPIPIIPTTITSTTPTTNTSPVLFITPEVLQALQSYSLNNFPDIGLPNDIQEVAKNFLATLPPLILLTPTTAATT